MIFKRRLDVLAAVVLAAAMPLSACGGDPCEDYCENAQGCENAEFAQGPECVSSCQAAIDQTEADKGCADELEDVLDCSADADDTCNPTECLTEALSYLQCAGFGDD